MIDLSGLEEFVPQPNRPVRIEGYTFEIVFQSGTDTFALNLRIKRTAAEEHVIKFRFGIGKDLPPPGPTHNQTKPHFEIDLYRRTENAINARIYFTFVDPKNVLLEAYAKATLALIKDILAHFIERHRLGKSALDKLVYSGPVEEELSRFKPKLLGALAECYRKHTLVVRTEDGKRIEVTKEKDLEKYLNQEDIRPFYLELRETLKK